MDLKVVVTVTTTVNSNDGVTPMVLNVAYRLLMRGISAKAT